MTYSNPYASTSSPTNFIAFSGMGMRKGGRAMLMPSNYQGDGSTLNLDFTTGVLDPRLTFSRASTATFVNSSGYVEYAAHNLYYNTNFATIATGTVNPSLTNKGWGYVFQTGTATFNTDGSVTMSASAQRIGLFRSVGFAGTGRRLILSVDITSTGNTGVDPSQIINEGTYTNGAYYINGTLWTSGNVVGPCTVSFVYTSNTAGNAFAYFGLGMSSTSTGSATFANPRWGFYGGVNQLAYSPNTAATNANYLTAEYHAPRFDYSPTNIGEPRGLLVEGQTINVCPQSQALTTGWLNANMSTPTNPAIADPFGGTSATWKLVAPISTSALRGWRHAVVTLTAANYTFSFWAKAAEFDRIVLGDPGSGRGGCKFVLVGNGTATVIAGSTTPTNPTIELFPGGWYRCSVTMLMLASTYAMGIAGYPSATTPNEYGPTYVQTSLDGVYATGFQIELGSGASSYVPTGASQVTRNVDACSMSGSDFTNVFGDGSLGTLICSHEFPRADRGLAHQPTPWAIGNYVAANARGYSYANYAVGVGGYGWVYTSASFGSATTSAVSAAKNKCALSYNGLAITAALNGTTASSTGTGTITVSSATGLLIGYNSTPRDFINACVSNIKFYPTALTAAQLQTLTTL